MDTNRKTAYRTLYEIEKNRAYSNIELNRQISINQPDSPGFVRELVYGVLENKTYIDHILGQLVTKGLKGVKKEDLTILRMGIYQFIFMKSVPQYAAVDESVKMAKKFCRGREGFINGVLRGYTKQKELLKFPEKENISEYLSIMYSYEPWIVNLWLDFYGAEKTEAMLKAGNETPELSIRVNTLKTDTEEVIKILEDHGFKPVKSEKCDGVIRLRGSHVLSLPQFSQGYFSVQDEASVMAVKCLDPKEGSEVIDICAAPGGKSLAMAEHMSNKGHIKSFDIYEHKLKILQEEAERLGIDIITAMENDGTVFNEKLVNSADFVLADVPCSGLGVIRKKPEIKYKKIEDRGLSLAEKQYKILENSGEYVREQGFLMYSTCTVNKIENEYITGKFLKEHKNFQLILECQLMPDTDKTDGFYFCKMKKLQQVKGD